MPLRERSLCLDGPWLLGGKPIEVPFPPQAEASGYEGGIGEELQYTRTFTLPEGFFRPDERVNLCFGAVDQVAWVFVNGRPATSHEGGYLPFQADITDLLRPGENELTVVVQDALLHRYPYGKQSLKPHGMWYTPVSGIWQSVWLEVTSALPILNVAVTPRMDSVEVLITGGAPTGIMTVTLDGAQVAVDSYAEGKPRVLRIPSPQAWSPESPTLYLLTVRAGTDEVRVRFGLRVVDIAPDGHGIPRLRLNGASLLLLGVLDQGYYPGGHFRPVDGAAGYEADILRMKALGFNTLRMHIKVEDEAFYDACDRLGMLVIQDMPQSGHYSYVFDTFLPNLGLKHRPDHLPGSRDRRAFFERHCADVQQRLRCHPCVVAYTIFNEGWGQYDTDRLYRDLRARDSSRVYISASGWFKGHETDLDSDHVYFRNRRLKPSGKRPLLLSECGGYVRAVAGHLNGEQKQYGYGSADTPEALTDKIAILLHEMVEPAIPAGLCGVIYTQLSDVEGELNGLYTFDREVCKVDAERLSGLLAQTRAVFDQAVSQTERRTVDE